MDCITCMDSGNNDRTGFQHYEYDELGCSLCGPESLCCDATWDAQHIYIAPNLSHGHALCDSCNHPIIKVPRPTPGTNPGAVALRREGSRATANARASRQRVPALR